MAGLICHIKCLAALYRCWWQTPNIPLWSVKHILIRGEGTEPLIYSTAHACAIYVQIVSIVGKVINILRNCLHLNIVRKDQYGCLIKWTGDWPATLVVCLQVAFVWVWKSFSQLVDELNHLCFSLLWQTVRLQGDLSTAWVLYRTLLYFSLCQTTPSLAKRGRIWASYSYLKW